VRILILGGDGMLGHQLLAHLAPRHDVRVTLRQPLATYASFGLFTADNAHAGVDLRTTDPLRSVLEAFRPEAVINAAGIVKQRPDAEEAIASLEINALLPHRLALLCRPIGARLVHVSTDCVFSGRKGNYAETDPPDADDLYGRTKVLGEVDAANCITLRTSFIGRELARKTSLLEWFLSQRGPIRGFRKAIFSGFTTIEMARIVELLLARFPAAGGLYHVSSEPISKFDLLGLVKQRLGLAVEIAPYDDFVCDRSLDSSRFRKEFGYRPPPWDAMVAELAGVISAPGTSGACARLTAPGRGCNMRITDAAETAA
jgi:dTDP-4-dehydrorhamnose reductase